MNPEAGPRVPSLPQPDAVPLWAEIALVVCAVLIVFLLWRVVVWTRLAVIHLAALRREQTARHRDVLARDQDADARRR